MNWSSYGFELSQRLRAVRLMRGYSQEKLAEYSGLSRNQISNLERNDNNNLAPGDPHLSKIYALARALEVPPVVLLPAATVLVESLCRSSHVLNVEIAWPAPGSQAVRLTHAADDYEAALRAQFAEDDGAEDGSAEQEERRDDDGEKGEAE